MVSTESATKKKKRSEKQRSELVDHEDRRHRRDKYTLIHDNGDDGQQHHYDKPRRSKHQHKRVVLEDDHLYDVVRPRGIDDDANTYQNIVAPEAMAVYQNMDDL